MSDKTRTFSRKPYKSGSSHVITVGGIPILSKESAWVGKHVQVGGEDAVLFLSTDDVTEDELASAGDKLTFEDD